MAALALLVFMTPSLVAWGQDNYVVEFNSTNGDDGTTEITTLSDIVASGADYIASITDASKVYKGKQGFGVKLGSSKAVGTFTMNLSDEGKVDATSIVFNSCKYGSDNSSLKITINGSITQTFELTSDLADYTYTFNNATEITSIKVEGVTKRIYVKSMTVNYGGTTPSLEDNDLALTGAPIALEFDLYNNNDAQVINYTTSSTGAVSVSASDYITAVVDETAKTITVTPTAVTPSIQTITVSQAADATYAAGSTSFTVYIEDSTPFNGDIFIFNTDEGLVDLGITKPASGAGTDLEAGHDYVIGSVTMNCTHASTHTRVWNSNGVTDLRVYSTATLTFAVAASLHSP